VNDVNAARAAGFGIVCVTYGYNHGNDIRASAPDALIDSLAELPELFALARRVNAAN
jgi:phosphoglycolate phosphatase